MHLIVLSFCLVEPQLFNVNGCYQGFGFHEFFLAAPPCLEQDFRCIGVTADCWYEVELWLFCIGSMNDYLLCLFTLLISRFFSSSYLVCLYIAKYGLFSCGSLTCMFQKCYSSLP